MVGDTPGQLLERNYIVLNFDDPCAIKDTSWIKPGKVFRSMSLSTEGCKPYIDYAAKMGMQYVLFDAGWYGSWGEPDSDASRPFVEKTGYKYWLPAGQRPAPTGRRLTSRRWWSTPRPRGSASFFMWIAPNWNHKVPSSIRCITIGGSRV